MKNCFK